MRMIICRCARAAIVLAAVAAPLAPCAAEPGPKSETEPAILPEGMDWNATLFDVTTLNADRKPDLSAANSKTPKDTSWSRTDKPDGSSSVTVKRTLPTEWDTKVGADLNVPASGERNAWQNYSVLQPQQDQGSGSVWTNMTLPGASVETRAEAQGQQEKLGTKLSKSIPVGSDLSVTLQNGFSVTHTLPAASAAASGGVPPSVDTPGAQTATTSVYSTDRAARLKVLSTGTSFSAGATTSSADNKWLRTFSAEQKLIGPLNVTGSVSETASGEMNKSFTAGFKRKW